MSTSAPAFSSNNPFRRPQQYPVYAVERQHSPAMPTNGVPPRNASPAIPPNGIPPRNASPAIAPPPPRRSSHSQNKPEFDFHDASTSRNAPPVVRREYPTGPNHYPNSGGRLPQSHSAQSVSLRDYAEKPRNNSVPHGGNHDLYPPRPTSTFYSNSKYSNSDQSLFHSKEPEMYEYNQQKPAGRVPPLPPINTNDFARLPAHKSRNPFVGGDDDNQDDDDDYHQTRVVPRTPTSAIRSRPATIYFEANLSSGNEHSSSIDHRRESRYADKPEYRDHPRVLRRTNSNDSIFAPFHPPPPSSRRPPPPKPSTKPSSSKAQPPLDLPPPIRPRHYRSNSDSSIMEPQFRRPPPNPAKDYAVSARREMERRGSDDKYNRSSEREYRRSGKSDRQRHSRVEYDSDYSDHNSSSRKYRSSSRKEHTSSTSSSRHHHSSSDRYRDEKMSSSTNRHRSSKDKDTKTSSSSSRRKNGHLDTIDRLDVTGFFGPGSFHHDGPFDACTPHRNKNTKKAPVAAFPINGANNSLSINVNRDRFTTESNILMQGDIPAYQDFSIGSTTRNTSSNPSSTGNIMRGGNINRSETNVTFDPHAKAAPVHGDTTMGLGSSTFLEGTPASKTALETAAAQQASAAAAAQVNVSRKKSLVHKLRGQNSSPAPPRPPRANYDQAQQYTPLLPTGQSGSSSQTRERSDSGNMGGYNANRRPSYDSSMILKDSSLVSSSEIQNRTGNNGARSESSANGGYQHAYHPSSGSSNSGMSASGSPSYREPPPPASKGSGLLKRVKSLKSSTRRGT